MLHPSSLKAEKSNGLISLPRPAIWLLIYFALTAAFLNPAMEENPQGDLNSCDASVAGRWWWRSRFVVGHGPSHRSMVKGEGGEGERRRVRRDSLRPS